MSTAAGPPSKTNLRGSDITASPDSLYAFSSSPSILPLRSRPTSSSGVSEPRYQQHPRVPGAASFGFAAPRSFLEPKTEALFEAEFWRLPEDEDPMRQNSWRLQDVWLGQ